METNKDIKGKIQNITTKLWELIKNSAEKIKELRDENISLKEQNQFLKNIIDKKDNASLDLATKNSELLNQIKMLNYNLNQKNKQIAVINEKLEISQNENEKFHNAGEIIEEKDRHIDELVLENKSLLKEYRLLKQEKNKAEIMLDQYENQSRNLSQEYLRLKEEFADVNQKYDSINLKISEAETEMIDYKLLKNEYDKLKLSYDELKKKITELSELTKNHTQLSHEIRNLEKENKILNIRLSKLNQVAEQNEFLRKDNINKNFIIHEKQKVIESEKEKSAILENYKFIAEKQKSEIAAFHNIFKNYENGMTELNEKLLKAETEVNVFDAKYDALSKKYKMLSSETISYGKINEKYQEAVISLKKFREMYAYKEKQLSSKELEIKQLNSKIAEIKNEMKIINTKFDEVKKTSEDFQNENKVAQEEYDKSLAKIEELEQTIAEMKTAKLKLIEEYERRGDEITSLNSEKSNFEKEIEIFRNKINELENQLISSDNLKEEIKILNKELKTKNTVINDLSDKFNTINKKYQRIKEQSDTILNRGEYLNEMMQKAGEKIKKHSKLKDNFEELESNFKLIKNDNTLKSIELDKEREKRENLENILKTRYEQIKLLEDQINEGIKKNREDKEERLKLSERIDKYIMHINSKLS